MASRVFVCGTKPSAVLGTQSQVRTSQLGIPACEPSSHHQTYKKSMLRSAQNLDSFCILLFIASFVHSVYIPSIFFLFFYFIITALFRGSFSTICFAPQPLVRVRRPLPYAAT